MTQKLSDNDKHLAGEYALGVLDRAEMTEAEKRFDQDALFREEVEAWQNRLTPMLEEVGEVVPDAAVWDKIDGAIHGSKEPVKKGIWHSLSFWRGFSVISSSLAAASIAALLVFPGSFLPAAPPVPLVAVLAPAGNAPAFMARFDPDAGSLVIRATQVNAAETRVAELWLIPGDGVPRSLGLLDVEGRANLTLNTDNQALFGDGGTLAISLEPAGGSPTGAPTGPVIASGKLVRL